MNQIQLVGDNIFSSDLFPAEHENIIAKGINVSHVVSGSHIFSLCQVSQCLSSSLKGHDPIAMTEGAVSCCAVLNPRVLTCCSCVISS